MGVTTFESVLGYIVYPRLHIWWSWDSDQVFQIAVPYLEREQENRLRVLHAQDGAVSKAVGVKLFHPCSG